MNKVCLTAWTTYNQITMAEDEEMSFIYNTKQLPKKLNVKTSYYGSMDIIFDKKNDKVVLQTTAMCIDNKKRKFIYHSLDNSQPTERIKEIVLEFMDSTF